ncbi:MAG: lipoprotein signal peptidase [Bacteroidetes bacterium]|nr:MAG: lipoprotein signal peptidase [Bacteroidota bacterium]
MKKYIPYILIVFIVIFIDQASKLCVHFNMEMGSNGQIKVFGNWFKIHYILNPGMAFGLRIDSPYGKLILTLFRILATILIAYYIKTLVDGKKHKGFIVCMALILGGALGNVVDSTFYGVFLNNAPAGSITPWFHGQVIDMIYVDIWEGHLPSWLGGGYYSFWPIFNIADSSIFIGVMTIIFRNEAFFRTPKPEPETLPTEVGEVG